MNTFDHPNIFRHFSFTFFGFMNKSSKIEKVFLFTIPFSGKNVKAYTSVATKYKIKTNSHCEDCRGVQVTFEDFIAIEIQTKECEK